MRKSELRRVALDGRLKYAYYPGSVERSPLLMHPWYGCSEFWNGTVEGLPELSCYVVDWYSLGEGEWQNFTGPEGLARAATALLDAEGIETCTLIGNSTGGIVAQIIAAADPSRIKHLVLVGTGPTIQGVRLDFLELLASWHLLSAPTREQTAEVVGSLLARPPGDPA